jgi:hypothetical protein
MVPAGRRTPKPVAASRSSTWLGVVGLAAGQQGGVPEFFVGDHRDDGLRQIEVDVGVHAEQDVPKGGQIGRGAERDGPGPARLASGQRGLEGIQVEVSERDVPALHPLRVGEAAALELFGDRDRGALVGRVEVPPRVARGLQRPEQGRHPAD